jgi:4-amino-4-deoxyprephenate dehydrogenase
VTLGHIVVIGSSGGVGSLLVRVLSPSAASLIGIDSAPSQASDRADKELLADVTSSSPAVKRALARADCVVVCLPENVALATLPLVARHAPAGALWVDTLSVKKTVCSALQESPSLESLSINPMFAPDLGFRNQNVAVVQVNAGPRAAAFLGYLAATDANIVTLSAEEHDKCTSVIQVATHATLLAFGMMLDNAGFDLATALKLSTPPHRLLLSLLHRITSGDPLLYWDIQQAHSLGSQTRQSLISAMTELEQRVANGERHEFVADFLNIRTRIAPGTASLGAILRGALESASALNPGTR